jgi:hypothetical protein
MCFYVSLSETTTHKLCYNSCAVYLQVNWVHNILLYYVMHPKSNYRLKRAISMIRASSGSISVDSLAPTSLPMLLFFTFSVGPS